MPPARSRLFFVRERLSRRRLLVDTGAEISVIPPVQSDRQRHQCGVHLQAAKGVTIATFFSAFAYSQPGSSSHVSLDFYYRRRQSPHTWS